LSRRPSNNPIPAVPPIDAATQRQKLGMLAWIRVGLGALSGLISGVLGFITPSGVSSEIVLNPNAYYGLYVAVFVYIASFYLAKYYIVKGIAQKDKNKLLTQGIGGYFMMFLFVWILFNTLSYCLAFRLCSA